MKRNLIFSSTMVAVLLIVASVFSIVEKTRVVSVSPADSSSQQFVVVIDPGHGGLDGGTSGSDGTVEKDLNLSIALKLKDYLDFLGIPNVMTRSEDVSIYSEGASTVKAKKTSDLKNRMELVNSYENSILISIHQNHYSEEKYWGTQVFYSANDEHSQHLAQLVQTTVSEQLQEGNNRQVKKAGSDLYLLYRAERPSILIECGFMSNQEENELLKDEAYQNKLAYCFTMAILQYLNHQ
ncbi:MAG: N-acetylmuramoyl-L-alanine amidase [Clostridiales bacterium]|nr:N-acetylmuramoyl-L-alanine amidase [Clostridiales bacterium]